MRVVAIDPGGTTGVAVWYTDGGLVTSEWDNKYELYQFLEQWSVEETIYVVESFTPRPGVRTWVPDSLHIIGYIDGRVVAWHYGSRLVMQSPAQAKSFATDAKLAKLGFSAPGQGHAKDAVRHLVVFLCTTEEGRKLGGQELLEKLVS